MRELQPQKNKEKWADVETAIEKKWLKELKRKFDELYELEPLTFSHASKQFAEVLRAKFKTNKGTKNFEEYRLFHLLAGSSHKECTEFDFPGEYSIENFINTQYREMVKEREEAMFE